MNGLASLTILVYFASITSIQTDNVINGEKHPIVNNFIVKLKEAVWNDGEKNCVNDTLEMLFGVKNRTLWATWAWDSMQSPVGVLYGSNYHLGNYDQCLKSPWSEPVLQYCLVDVEIEDPKPSREFNPYGDAEEYLKSLTKHGRSLSMQTFGVCLPSSCRPATTAKVYSLLHQLTYLVEGNVTVDPRECQVAGESRPWTFKFCVFWATIAALLIMVAVSTYHDYVEKKNSTIGIIREIIVVTFLALITKAFSFKSNVRELLKATDDDIKVIHGIRFLTAVVVVIIHESSVSLSLPLSNAMDADLIISSWYGQMLLHLDLAVDTFVVMSGLLLAKSLFSRPNNNLIISLLKRYIRLIGPYALMTLYFISSVYETGDGPIWQRAISKEADTCEEYWWKNFLMFNNDVRTLCHVVSWYISCDYQLAVMSTFLFFLYRKNKTIGLTGFFAVGTALTVKYGWMIYANNLSILPFENAKILQDRHKQIILNETYLNVEIRVAGYFVGVLMGYIIAIYKPKIYRNSINKTMSAVILLSSLATLMFIFSLGYLYSLKSYNAVEAAVLVVLHRGVWAMAICGIIGVAEYGCSNYITEFLGLTIFRPLSKLSYAIYMVHMTFIQRNLGSTRNPLKFDFYTVVVNSLGILNISCAASFMIYIIIEAPLSNISNEVFKEKKENDKMRELNNHSELNSKSKVF